MIESIAYEMIDVQKEVRNELELWELEFRAPED